jgi:hypothetical protein
VSATVIIPGAVGEDFDAPKPIKRSVPFTDRDRRITTKLTIPWSVRGLTHRLWTDEHTENKSEQEVYEELLGLALRGLVVNLGTRETPAKVVHAAQSHPDTIDMHDDSARLYAKRMQVPSRAFRCEGDTWMLTREGLEEIKAPTIESPPLTPSQLSMVIAREVSRVMWDYDGETADPSLLHPLVYSAWLADVVRECERVWGARPRIPIAGGASGWPDVWENFIIDHENQKTSLATNDAIATPWYMSLGIVAFSDTDTGATHGDATRLPTYTGYQANAVPAANMTAASAGSSSNNAAITFAAVTAGTSNIVSFGNNSVQANTSGIFRKWGDCTTTALSTTQTPAQFNTGTYTTTAN